MRLHHDAGRKESVRLLWKQINARLADMDADPSWRIDVGMLFATGFHCKVSVVAESMRVSFSGLRT